MEALHLILLATCTSLAAADMCFTDLKFIVTATRNANNWTAQTAVQYNGSVLSNPKLTPQPAVSTPIYYDYNYHETSVTNLAQPTTVPTPIFYDYNDLPETSVSDANSPFTVETNVDQCNYYCDNGPYVRITVTASKKPTAHRTDYDYYEGVGYYKYHTKPVTWDEARKICNDEGTHLGVINSEAESKIFGNYVATVPLQSGANFINLAHIGFHDRFVHGEYLTIFDEPLNETGFYRWFAPNQPDNAGGHEFCGSVADNGGLNDLACDLHQGFICEQELC